MTEAVHSDPGEAPLKQVDLRKSQTAAERACQLWEPSPHPLGLKLKRVAVATLLPMVKGMFAPISPTPNLAADETNP